MEVPVTIKETGETVNVLMHPLDDFTVDDYIELEELIGVEAFEGVFAGTSGFRPSVQKKMLWIRLKHTLPDIKLEDFTVKMADLVAGMQEALEDGSA